MRLFTLQAIAAPCLLAGCAAVAVLQQPAGRVSAYSGAGSVVYTAQVINATPASSLEPSSNAPKMLPATQNLPLRNAALASLASGRASPNPATRFDVRSKPTITPEQIDRVLAAYDSPMNGDGRQLYELGVKYGIDPAFCLAFFVHESAAGTRGEAVLTHNLGNIRAIAGAPSLDGYRYYDTWLEGAESWYRLISSLYVQDWGLSTVDAIIPVYAPSADSNDPAAYIADVEQLVSSWRAQV